LNEFIDTDGISFRNFFHIQESPVTPGYITHPDTRFVTDTPSPEHSGLYRDPIPLDNGNILVTHSSTTEYDANIGTFSMPISKYDFRLQLLEPDRFIMGNLSGDSQITPTACCFHAEFPACTDYRTGFIC